MGFFSIFRGRSKRSGSKADKLFPKKVERLWLSGVVCMNEGLDYEKEPNAILMPYWDTEDRYIEHKKGDIVPLYERKGHTAYYEILSWTKYPGSDPASFDDKREYNLALHHTEGNDLVKEDSDAK